MRALRIAIVVLGTLAARPALADDTAAGSATARHLLAGVRAFKDGRYDDALVELRVVARASDAPADLAFYLGPTLYKLGRHREALAVFITSRATPDALTDFYLGQTYYQLKLYRKARAVFAALRSRGLGPALDEAAGRYVDLVDAAYKQAPEPVAIDFYADEGLALAASDPVIAAEYLDEARQIEAVARDLHRHVEIVAALGAAWNAAARPGEVVGAFGHDPTLPPEANWQLARAYAALADGAHARPLLDAIVRARGPHAGDAAALAAKLPP